ncbi:MAG: 5-formyltetrahydrofolate cyclo-ligase [Prevotella sp.]|nr:5-formyltetrahydrofolate cyclo-ligase [Prevotella sp.]
MLTTAHSDKALLRKEIREEKKSYGVETLQRLSEPIIERLLADKLVKMARTVLLYASLPDEVDTNVALLRLQNDGKRILLPAVIGDGVMELREVRNTESLRKGVLGINEPEGPAFTDFDSIDVAVVPGMAFDRQGNRLGRGKGYYDRLLPLLKRTWKIGLCFDFQIKDSVPTCNHDVCMDEIIG